MEMIKQIPIKDLTLLERNPRKITKQAMDKLCESLKSDPEFLQKRPILVNAIDGRLEVYAGNQRVRAAKKLGWKEVPCIVDENLDAETLKSRVIKDNLSSGDWDYDILANEYEIGDLLEWGFEPEDFDVDIETIEGKEPEDDAPELPKDPQTKPGDLYELGDHRLLCGDSTNADDVQKLLEGREPILMVTDPPYNLASENDLIASNVSKSYEKLKNADWDKNFDICHFLNIINQFIPKNMSVYMFTSHHLAPFIWNWMKNNFDFNCWCVWEKTNPMPSLMKRHWTWNAELVCYATKGKHIFNFPKKGHANPVWHEEKTNEKTGHPTEKPAHLLRIPIEHSSNKNEEVFDPFLGSGTTLIAAEQLNRKCYGLEIDPGYCDIIVQRWVNYRKKNNLPVTVKLNGEEVKCQPVEEH